MADVTPFKSTVVCAETQKVQDPPADEYASLNAPLLPPPVPTASPVLAEVPTAPPAVRPASPVPAAPPVVPPASPLPVPAEVSTAPPPVPTVPAAVPPTSPVVPTVPVVEAPRVSQPGQMGTAGLSMQQIIEMQHRPATRSVRRGPSVATRIVRVALGAVLVAGIGLGARLGWDVYQERQDEADELAADEAATTPDTDLDLLMDDLDDLVRPTATKVDVSFEVPDLTYRIVYTAPDGDVSLRTAIDESDGSTTYYEFEHDGTGRYFRPDTVSDWLDATSEPDWAGFEEAFDRRGQHVLLLRDVIPAPAIPHTMLLSRTPEQLDVRSVDGALFPATSPAVAADAAPTPPTSIPPVAPLVTAPPVLELPAPTDPATTSAPPTPIPTVVPDVVGAGSTDATHYRVSIDVPAFAMSSPTAYADWQRMLRIEGFDFTVIDDGLDVWVDEFGLVRRLSNGSLTMTLHDVGSASSLFDEGRVAQPYPREEPS